MNSWLPSALDAIFQTSFLCALLMFWLCVYHGLRQNDRRFIVFYLPKVALVGSIWFSMVTVTVWQEFEETNDPTFSFKFDTDHLYVIIIFSLKSSFYKVILLNRVSRYFCSSHRLLI